MSVEINFFNRPVETVANEFAAGIYNHETKKVTPTGNPGKIIEVSTLEGVRQYRVSAVEPYIEKEATSIWRIKRAKEINELAAGETITYRSRSGELTFIKTTGADNILICRLEEIGTKLKVANASAVTKTLGLNERAIGRLTLIEDDQFKFVKVG